MNVIVVKHVCKKDEFVFSTGYSKKRGFFRLNPPRGGHFKVCWKRKHGVVKDITGLFRNRKAAERIAKVLNDLSAAEAKELVSELHSMGKSMLRDHQLKNPTYTGRSFARE